ncbi:MAG: UDP-N-acetylmuramoyl-L-alanyl-D-glutamate--2,6-diaminopimelate ligase [Kiritimatiellaeota bacterium]|nr:UDP-N-acetylmuramoyl-L-alanyl-D-glutamate--2,6-diaminopimelate ligase [Kiritimatiellota bacterium]
MRLKLKQIIEKLGDPLACLPRNAAYDGDKFAERVVNNSGKCVSGAVFVGINGAKTDGRLFIHEAAEKGVAAIFAEAPLPIQLSADFSNSVFIVSDAYAAYARLAEIFQDEPANELRLWGVTGTNGKTTTAFLMRSVIERWTGEPCGLISTVEYSTGDSARSAERTTPDAVETQAILAETRDSRSSNAVIEVSSHALVQSRLGTARFAAAVFTNLTGDHLDYHGTMEEYFDAKKLLFTKHLASDGTAVVNIDDPFGRRLAELLIGEGRRVATFGFSDEADFRIFDMKTSLIGTILVLLQPDSGKLHLKSTLCGAFNAANIAGAAAAALTLGAPPEIVAEGIASMKGVPGRMERCGDTNIFVDYAHTDAALANVLLMMRELLDSEVAGGRLIVLFGCGGDRDKSKRSRMGAVAARFADRIFVTSDNPRSESPSAIIADILEGVPSFTDLEVVEDRREAIAKAVGGLRPNDALIIAGKGHETYQEINGKRFPFDDRKVAVEPRIFKF